MILKIKKLCDKAEVPFRATKGSAGMDLKACIDEPVTINPGERQLISTGLAIALESADYVAYIFARSGLAVKLGITLSNCVGVIDSDYRGELKVGLINHSNEPYTVNSGERIAQLVISPVILPEVLVVDSLEETERNAGGFGSTGKV
jgi:dUTP pyrophosphatase